MKFTNTTYLPVVAASQYSGYNPDYLTQMCRKKQLLCKQISKVWFISLNSLNKYLKTLDKHPVMDVKLLSLPEVDIVENMNSSFELRIKDELYLDSTTASKLSSYNRDYLTQLARSGDVKSIKLGKVWFFSQKSLLKHMRRAKNAHSHSGDTDNIERVDISIHTHHNETKKVNKRFIYEKEEIGEFIPKLKPVQSNNKHTNNTQVRHIPINRKRLGLQIHNNFSYTKDNRSVTRGFVDTKKPIKHKEVFNNARDNDKSNNLPKKTNNKHLNDSKKSRTYGNVVYTVSSLNILDDEITTSPPKTSKLISQPIKSKQIKTRNSFIEARCHTCIETANVLIVLFSIFLLIYFNLIFYGFVDIASRTL